MSSILDLDGDTITLTADDYYQYYQITDTSTGHNGTLILEEGAHLRFDNASDAGFNSEALYINIHINGTSTNNCAITSVDPWPSSQWTMPGPATYIDAYYCEFRDYTGEKQAQSWAFDNCLMAGERYCSGDDLKNMTQAQLERIPLGIMVESGTKWVKAKLQQYGLAGCHTDEPSLAALYMSIVQLLLRYRMDGTKPQSLSMGGLSMSDDIDGAIESLVKNADRLCNEYVKRNATISRFRKYMIKVNP